MASTPDEELSQLTLDDEDEEEDPNDDEDDDSDDEEEDEDVGEEQKNEEQDKPPEWKKSKARDYVIGLLGRKEVNAHKKIFKSLISELPTSSVKLETSILICCLLEPCQKH